MLDILEKKCSQSMSGVIRIDVRRNVEVRHRVGLGD